MNNNNTYNILWGYLTELRKELVESQKIRTQVIGFKITFVTALIGFFISKSLSEMGQGVELAEYNYYLLIIPALASIFFDFLIYSYSFSIKRIGLYIKFELEPQLQENFLDSSVLLWQKFLEEKITKQKLARIGNLGLTIIAVVIAIISILLSSNHQMITISAIIILSALVGVDIWGMYESERLIENINQHYKKKAVKKNNTENLTNENAT